ncbi:DUF4229 domain-containing protein [Streptosporangiaceae bacterium NEAU-GS5]|nr:DUF4229 domain-containing protein [Streptosporangiaceae bacterium NEAU-GS5]
MRQVFVYTLSRIALFAVTLGVLYLLGLRNGFVLLVAALVISGLASYVLLSKQRDELSERIAGKQPDMRTGEGVQGTPNGSHEEGAGDAS